MILALILAIVGLAGYELYQSGSLSNLFSFSFGGAGGTLNAVQIAQYALNAGWTGADLSTAVAIALAESGGNSTAQGDYGIPIPGKYNAFGLWQINIGENPQFASDNLFDTQTNANDAYILYESLGFSAWTTYKTGKYLSFLTQAQVGVQNA